METPRLRLSDEAIQAITQRVAASNGDSPNLWEQYQRFLKAASAMLDRAPQNAQECAELDIEERLNEDLTRFIEAAYAILPGGILELVDFLPENLRRGKWSRNIR